MPRLAHHRLTFLKRVAQAALLAIVVLLFSGAGYDSRFNDLGHRLMCVCSCNQILLECNHVGCAYSDRMRGELMAAVDHGDNDDVTLQSFVQKYGPTVLAVPTKSGFDRVAWIAPYAALLLGLVLVTFIVRAWRFRPLLLPVDSSKPVQGAELKQFRERVRKETGL